MTNEIKKYEPTVQLVTERALQGLEKLADEEAVDASIERAYVVMKFADQIREGMYQFAEDRQGNVITQRASDFKDATKAVERAGKAADPDACDSALDQSIKAGLCFKESVNKMRHIQNRGIEAYNSSEKLASYIRSIEASVNKDYTALPPSNGG